MRLFEAMIDANHRAVAGDPSAGLRPADFASELPIVALTCLDVRLNPLLPEVLGVPEDQFIWLRNAGNIITDPLGSTVRSLALACAVEGGQGIAIIGHTDCPMSQTTALALLDQFRSLGVERHQLPPNLNEFFGLFGSERANVIKAADIVRQSPLIGPKIPVHGLLVDIETGQVDWLVNGYQTLDPAAPRPSPALADPGQPLDALKPLANLEIGGLKFPEEKIGETLVQAGDWLAAKVQEWEAKLTPPEAPAPPAAAAPVVSATYEAWRREKERLQRAAPPKIPTPPPIPPKLRFHKKAR